MLKICQPKVPNSKKSSANPFSVLSSFYESDFESIQATDYRKSSLKSDFEQVKKNISTKPSPMSVKKNNSQKPTRAAAKRNNSRIPSPQQDNLVDFTESIICSAPEYSNLVVVDYYTDTDIVSLKFGNSYVLEFKTRYTRFVPRFVVNNFILADKWYLSGAITPNFEYSIKTPTIYNEVNTQPIISQTNQCLSSVVVVYYNQRFKFFDIHGCITESVHGNISNNLEIGREIVRTLGEEFGSMYTGSDKIDVYVDITEKLFIANINVNHLELLAPSTIDIKIPQVERFDLYNGPDTSNVNGQKIVLYIQGTGSELEAFLAGMNSKFRDEDNIYGYGIMESDVLKSVLRHKIGIFGKILVFPKK